MHEERLRTPTRAFLRALGQDDEDIARPHVAVIHVLARRVRVNAVCPALVSDGFVERSAPALYAARAEHQIARAPLRKVGRPEEVAADVYWLAAAASLITGSVIALDCGLHLNGDG